MFSLSSITKSIAEALNAAPDVDELQASLGTPTVEPRVVAEYGGLHSATCIDYDPVQRLLAVGVDTGVKVLGAGGLEVLLSTPHHVEPALAVQFVPSTGRVLRLSTEWGIDVWSLHAQTLLASARWPTEVTSVCGLRRSPFVLVGQADGTMRVAAVQARAGGGALVPRDYRVTRREATKSEGEGESAPLPLVAVTPQPGAEAGRVLLAYADGELSLWDFHARRPAALTSTPDRRSGIVGKALSVGALHAASWVGGGGAVVATGHEAGLIVLWGVPVFGPGRDAGAPRTILPLRAIRPQAVRAGGGPGPVGREPEPIRGSTMNDDMSDDDATGAMPVRRVVARAAGGATAPFRMVSERPGGVVCGVLLAVGGEAVAKPDPPRLIPLTVDPPILGQSGGGKDGGGECGFTTLRPACDEGEAGALPWFGGVCDAALVAPPGRPETSDAAVVLSEGGQIHVHDIRAALDGRGLSRWETTETLGDSRVCNEHAGTNDDEPPSEDGSPSGRRRAPPPPLSAAEVTVPLPALSADCPPAIVSAGSRFLRIFRAASEAAAAVKESAPRDAWGAAWPVSGGAVGPGGAGRRTACVAAAAEGAEGAVLVFAEGAGRFVPVATAGRPTGLNAGGSARDRAVTTCHLAAGGALLVVGRASGAVEIHAAAGDWSAPGTRRRGVIRQLDSGMDLVAAGASSSSSSSSSPGGTDATVPRTDAYELVGELGVHAAAITCLATDAACSMLAVGDATGAASLVDLRDGRMTFVTSAFHGEKGAGGEAVTAAAFSPAVAGVRRKAGRENNEGEDGDGGDPSPRLSASFSSSTAGAEVLVLASSGSALTFLDTATGVPVGRSPSAMKPKTPSRALAVAPLTAVGVPVAHAAAVAKIRPEDFWFERTKRAGASSDTVAAEVSINTDEAALGTICTALVGVASTEALRVYPANGAAKGERHTVKKVAPDEPLVAAALVIPRPDAGIEDAHLGEGPTAGAAAFAAVSSHGRLLVWALPGLVPLAAVGPLPPLSASDACGFDTDGAVISLCGGGSSVAKMSVRPRPTPGRGGAAAMEAETGVVLYDDELAAAADAADEAAEATAEAAGAANSPHAAVFIPIASPPPAAEKGAISKDLGRTAGSLFKGDVRSGLASFGSVMRATKAKAAVAMERAKEKMDKMKGGGSLGGLGGGGDVGGVDPADQNRRYTPADLAVLFAEAEAAPPLRRVAAPPNPHPSSSSSSSSGATPQQSRSGRGGADSGGAERAELFRTTGRTDSGSSFGGGSPSSAAAASSSSSPFGGTRLNTAAEIRAKYGRERPGDKEPSPGAGGVSEVRGTMEQTRNKLLERGEKLSSLQDKTAQMQSDAEDFHAMAKKLAKQNESWW